MLAIEFGLGSVGNLAMRHAFQRLDTNHNGKLELSGTIAAFESLKSLPTTVINVAANK